MIPIWLRDIFRVGALRDELERERRCVRDLERECHRLEDARLDALRGAQAKDARIVQLESALQPFARPDHWLDMRTMDIQVISAPTGTTVYPWPVWGYLPDDNPCDIARRALSLPTTTTQEKAS